MNTNNLRIKHPAAYCLWCCLKQTDDDSAPITAQELGWTEAKFRAALERLQALGLVRVETIRQRRKITALEAVGTATEKLRAVEARETERWRPVRVENAQLIMSDGKGWDLPLEMRGAEFEEYWTSFATLTDLKLEQDGKGFTPAQFFRNMLEIVEAGKKTNSYNVSYVYNAYTEFIKTGKYDIAIANKLADKSESKAPAKVPEKAPEIAQKSGTRPTTHDGLRALAGIIESALIDGGLTMQDAEKLVYKKWENWDSAFSRVKDGYPTDEEIRKSVADVARKNGTAITPNKAAHFINNARNPAAFKKPTETKKHLPFIEVEEAFNSACMDPKFLPRIKAKTIRKWCELERMAPEQQRILMIEQYELELVEAGV